MSSAVIADAGAIVAALHERDQWHMDARTLFSELPKPFLTCEPAITEACYLLDKLPKGRERVLGLLGSGVLKLDFVLSKEIDSVSGLLQKYRDVPMSLADACLVRMCEINSGSLIFTFDSDFNIYRKHRNRPIPLVLFDGKQADGE